MDMTYTFRVTRLDDQFRIGTRRQKRKERWAVSGSSATIDRYTSL
jgi:hypothetical protein